MSLRERAKNWLEGGAFVSDKKMEDYRANWNSLNDFYEKRGKKWDSRARDWKVPKEKQPKF